MKSPHLIGIAAGLLFILCVVWVVWLALSGPNHKAEVVTLLGFAALLGSVMAWAVATLLRER